MVNNKMVHFDFVPIYKTRPLLILQYIHYRLPGNIILYISASLSSSKQILLCVQENLPSMCATSSRSIFVRLRLPARLIFIQLGRTSLGCASCASSISRSVWISPNVGLGIVPFILYFFVYSNSTKLSTFCVIVQLNIFV